MQTHLACRFDVPSMSPAYAGVGLDYADECLIFSTRFVRSFTQDRDVGPTTSILFVVTLRNLG